MTRAVTGKRSPRYAVCKSMEIKDDNGDTYLKRMRLLDTPLFGLYIHHIEGPDPDPAPHDHPYNFWSLIWRGGYTEEWWPFSDIRIRHESRTWRRWSVHRIGVSEAHKITEVQPRTVTLILRWRRRSSWGFWTDNGFRDWRKYTNAA